MIHDLRLKHYSDAPVEFRREPVIQDGFRFDKPRGFWVSVEGEDDWKTWCEAEEFGLGRLAVEHDVTLTVDANVLLIDSLDALREFADKWKVERGDYRDGIQWAVLEHFYDGIIIAPYQWGARLDPDTSFYYGWDCASGCIWNSDAIESITPVREVVPS